MNKLYTWKRALYMLALFLFFIERYTNADLEISLYVAIHIKIIFWKFFILNPKNSRVILW